PVWQIGLIGLLVPVGQIVSARVSGVLIAGRGPMLPFFAGLAIMLAAVLGLAAIGIQPLSPTYAMLVLFGVGGGLFQPAGFANALATASPQERARVGALVRFATNLGIATGGWVSVATGARPWVAAAVLLAIAAVLAARLLGPSAQQAELHR